MRQFLTNRGIDPNDTKAMSVSNAPKKRSIKAAITTTESKTKSNTPCGMNRQLAGELAENRPHNAMNYRQWLLERWEHTSATASWAVTLGIVAMGGLWAIIGALATGLAGTLDVMAVGIVYVLAVGPMVEEMMKVAATLVVVEKRPFYYRSGMQIMLCSAAGGLVFACVENVLYLHVYVPQPSDELVQWRWTVCVALHVGCSIIAGMGLVRMWRKIRTDFSRAQLSLAFPYLVTAVCTHGAYNACAVVLSLTLYDF